MDIWDARRIALKLRCDYRTVLRESEIAGAVRGMLGEAIRAEFERERARQLVRNVERPRITAERRT